MKSNIIAFLILALLTSSLTLGIQNRYDDSKKRDVIPSEIEDTYTVTESDTLTEQVTVKKDGILLFETDSALSVEVEFYYLPIILNYGKVHLDGTINLVLNSDHIGDLNEANIKLIDSNDDGIISGDFDTMLVTLDNFCATDDIYFERVIDDDNLNDYIVAFDEIKMKIGVPGDCDDTINEDTELENANYYFTSTVTITDSKLSFLEGTKLRLDIDSYQNELNTPVLFEVEDGGSISLNGFLILEVQSEEDISFLENNEILIVSGHDGDKDNVFSTITIYSDDECISGTFENIVEENEYRIKLVEYKRSIGIPESCDSTISSEFVGSGHYNVDSQISITSDGKVSLMEDTNIFTDYELLRDEVLFSVENGGSLELNGYLNVNLDKDSGESIFNDGGSMNLVNGEYSGEFIDIIFTALEGSCIEDVSFEEIKEIEEYSASVSVTLNSECLGVIPFTINHNNGLIVSGEQNEILTDLTINDGFIRFQSGSSTKVNVIGISNGVIVNNNDSEDNVELDGEFVFSFDGVDVEDTFGGNGKFELKLVDGLSTLKNSLSLSVDFESDDYDIVVSGSEYDEVGNYIVTFKLLFVIPEEIETDFTISGDEFVIKVKDNQVVVTINDGVVLKFEASAQLLVRLPLKIQEALFKVLETGIIDIEEGVKLILELTPEDIEYLKELSNSKKRSLLQIIDGNYEGEFDSVELVVLSNDPCDQNIDVDISSEANSVTVELFYEGCPSSPTPEPSDETDETDEDEGEDNDTGVEDDDDEDDDEGGLTSGAIAGIVIASVLGALLIGIVITLVVKKSRKGGSSSGSRTTSSYEAQTRTQGKTQNEVKESEDDTEDDETDEEDSEEEDSEEESSDEDSDEGSEEESSEIEDSDEGSEEDSDEGSEEDSDEGSEEDSDEGSDEDSDEGSDESSGEESS